MALLNRFSKLNDRGETGIFTFIVTKSVTRDFHRDATTKDFCFGYHRWAISFQRPTEKVLGVHLLLRNPSPSTACVVDFSLTLLNREHFSQNEVYSKKQAKFTITNPMQVSFVSAPNSVLFFFLPFAILDFQRLRLMNCCGCSFIRSSSVRLSERRECCGRADRGDEGHEGQLID